MDSNNTYTDLYQQTVPSVISIYIAPGSVQRTSLGAGGSGFVFDESGNIITNAHVVADVPEVELRFSEGEWRRGVVGGTDIYTDLAVVSVREPPEYANPLPMATENPVPGEPVAAFGNPMGLDGTMTTGIVSGTSRSTPSGNGFSIPDTIQTDAAINPGNSGGPLVTLDGEVVGVNRAKSGDNIGFAISPRIVNRVVPGLIESGRYRHSYIQIRTIDVSPSVAAANDLDSPAGVLVVSVGSGPSRRVLRPCTGSRRIRGRRIPVGGDVIVGINGEYIASHEELTRYLVTETIPGQIVEIELRRDGRPTSVRMELSERPDLASSNRSRRILIDESP